jgi:hypothetical protein
VAPRPGQRPERPARPARDPRYYPSDAQVEQACSELTEKSIGDIHRETALVWAARGLAALRLYQESEEKEPAWLADAGEYLHEALEHAALALPVPPADEDPDKMLERIAALLRSGEADT